MKTFNSTDIFSGVSVESLAENIDSFNAIGTVSRAWPAKRIHLEEILDQSFSDAAAAANYSIHDMTGVDKLHAAGITGKGAIVAVVDTGIYYPHPDVNDPQYPVATLAENICRLEVDLVPDSRLQVDMTMWAMAVSTTETTLNAMYEDFSSLMPMHAVWPDSGETEPDNDPIDTRGGCPYFQIHDYR